MFMTRSPSVLTYQIWSTLKRLNLINKSVLTGRGSSFVYEQPFSIAFNNILINDSEKEKLMTSENNVANKNLQKSNDSKNLNSIEIDFASKVIDSLNNNFSNEPLTEPTSIRDNLQSNQIGDTSKDLSHVKITDLIEHFERISWYAYKNYEKIDIQKYQNILDNILKFTYSDSKLIYRILYSLELWRASTNDKEYILFLKQFEANFTNINQWSIKDILLINNSFYRLNFLNDSIFTNKSLLNLNIRALDLKDLLQFVFLLRARRQRIQIPLKELEQSFIKHSISMNVNELGMMALLFYRYKYQYSKRDILLLFIKKLKENVSHMDPICLSSIVKSLKGTIDLKLIKEYISLFKALETNLSKINSLCMTHILHLQVKTLISNDYIISETLKRYSNNMKHLRIKDIERMLLVLHQFNYNSKEIIFFNEAVTELLHPDRIEERQTYPSSFLYCALYLLEANFYSEEIINIITDPKFIKLIPYNQIWQTYITIEKCIELDHPHVGHIKLDNTLLNTFYMLAEMHSESMNSYFDKRQNIITDVIYQFKCTFGSDVHICVGSPLPHTFMKDIIICYNKKNKQFLSPINEVSKYSKKEIKYAPKDGNIWYNLIIGSNNHTLKPTNVPSGFLTMHMRHLKIAGYTPILINFSNWMKNKRNILREIFYK